MMTNEARRNQVASARSDANCSEEGKSCRFPAPCVARGAIRTALEQDRGRNAKRWSEARLASAADRQAQGILEGALVLQAFDRCHLELDGSIPVTYSQIRNDKISTLS